MIAAIPVVGSKHQLAIIQHGKCIKTCRNYSSAKTFILSLTKGAASALLL
jgi:hypothetical protein